MPTWSWDRGTGRVAVGTAVGLVVGVVLGALLWGLLGRTDLLGGAGDPEPGRVLAVGVVTVVHDEPGNSWGFELPVFNATDAPLDARLVTFEGTASSLTSDPVTKIPPGGWRSIPFTSRANCDTAPVGGIASVRLRVRTPEGRSVENVPLPEAGRALTDYYRTVCGTGALVTAYELEGVWSLEKVYGPNIGLVDALLLRFEEDGSFTADAEQGLFSPNDYGVRGTYRVSGELVTIKVRSGYGCRRGGNVTWRVSVDGNDVLSLVWVRGDCPAGEAGDAWVARRVLRDERLPDSPGRSDG